MPQEGRGIGLANKIRAYALQDAGADTVDANRMLGLPDDARSYTAVPHMLYDMNVRSIQLMTNNPMKVQRLRELGVVVTSTVPIVCRPNRFNRKYLQTKAERMGHALPHQDPEAAAAVAGAVGGVDGVASSSCCSLHQHHHEQMQSQL